jgi:ABC-type branched-subunit amino acid transport system ATPase component
LSVAKAKLFAFSASAGVAGLAGVLIAYQNTYVQYSSFSVFTSVSAVIGSVLGGVGYLVGALIGGFGATGGLSARIVNIFTSSGDVGLYVSMVLGILLVITLVANPDGIASFVSRGGKIGATARTRPRRAKRKVSVADTAEAGPEVAQSKTGSILFDKALREQRDPVAARTLVVENLSVRFGAVTALENLSLRVEPGTVVGLMGPNGAGKTTLIDAVTGFVGASSGTVRIDDSRIGSYGPARRAVLGVRRTFQSLELFEEVTVSDNIRVAIEADMRWAYWKDLFWPRLAPLTPAAKAAIAILGLNDDLERRPSELPLGRRRLVAIARAIASEPSILLLDEPAAGLDEEETRELGLLIRSLADEWGLSILLVEHDVPLLMSVCDSLVAIDHGRYVTSGTPQDVRHHPEVIASYLGTEPEGTQDDRIESVLP